jgi:hypothetical protein
MSTMQLTDHYPCTETVEALELLLEDAKQGRVNGLAFVAFEKGQKFSIGYTGTAHKNPTRALGPVFIEALLLANKAISNGRP